MPHCRRTFANRSILLTYSRTSCIVSGVIAPPRPIRRSHSAIKNVSVFALGLQQEPTNFPAQTNEFLIKPIRPSAQFIAFVADAGEEHCRDPGQPRKKLGRSGKEQFPPLWRNQDYRCDHRPRHQPPEIDGHDVNVKQLLQCSYADSRLCQHFEHKSGWRYASHDSAPWKGLLLAVMSSVMERAE